METRRLLLEKFEIGDLDFLYRLNNDKAVNKYLSYDFVSLEKCSDWINNWKSAYENTGVFGVYKISLKENSTPVGLVFIVEREKSGKVELGYRLLPEFWRNGYCTEASMELLNQVFINTDTTMVFAETHPENIGSINFLLSLGFRDLDNNDKDGGRLFIIEK